MEGIHKFIWLLIALAIVSGVLLAIQPYYYAHEYGASDVPQSTVAAWKLVLVLIGAIQNLASALWLRYESKRAQLESLVWPLFGLLFGLFAVGIFYLKAIYEQKPNE
jgi:uncharacterized membrane-anchored protein